MLTTTHLRILQTWCGQIVLSVIENYTESLDS